MKYQQLTPKIWTIEGFLSQAECDQLILFGETKGFEAAEVSLPSGSKMMKGIRNNYRILYEDEKLAQTYWDRLKQYCPLTLDAWKSVGLNECFRFYRYDLNQRFKRHIDGRYKKSNTEESRITFMIYLNEDFEGGETAFDDVSIEAKTGMALCFIHEQKHEGCPVQSGCKYVLRSDVMYREN